METLLKFRSWFAFSVYSTVGSLQEHVGPESSEMDMSKLSVLSIRELSGKLIPCGLCDKTDDTDKSDSRTHATSAESLYNSSPLSVTDVIAWQLHLVYHAGTFSREKLILSIKVERLKSYC